MKNLITVSKKEELYWTTSKYVYNKLYKRYLNNIGEIHCDRCPYHKCENYEKKWYGGYERYKNSIVRYADGSLGETYIEITYPSWKLVSKNKKQWMHKPKSYQIKEEVSKHTGSKYIEIKF